jgi:putative ABC transport system substrate-binding protein
MVMGLRQAKAIAAVLLLSAAPLAVEAQQAKTAPRVGLLLAGSPGSDARVEAFRRALRDLGYVEGQNIVIEYRYADGNLNRLPELAAEMVRLDVNIIVTDGTRLTRAARNATKTIPIVMANDGDPIGDGHVASLARPGGNITGLANLLVGLAAKRLEVLRTAFPGISRVGVIWNPGNSYSASAFNETRIAARSLGLELQSLEVRGPRDFESAVQAASSGKAAAIAVLSDAFMFAHRREILELAARQKLPTMHTQSLWAKAGGLMSYGTDSPGCGGARPRTWTES